MSQSLNNSNDFIKKQLPVLNEWIERHLENDSLVKIDSAEILQNTVKLKGRIKDKMNWEILNQKSDSIYNIKFGSILFEKVAFLCDLQFKDLEFELQGADTYVFLKFKEGKVEEAFMDKMGEIADNNTIPTGNLSDLAFSNKEISGKQVNTIKDLFIQKFKNYFIAYKAKFEKYRFQVVTKLDNRLIFDVDNVVNAILDEGYFEHIRLSFTFTQTPQFLNVSYTILGKYGAGIIWAPKRSDYSNMDPKYAEYLTDFSLKLQNLIHDMLISKN